MLSAGIARATRRPPATTIETIGRRITRVTIEPQTRDSLASPAAPGERDPALVDPVAEPGQHRRQDRQRREHRDRDHGHRGDRERDEGRVAGDEHPGHRDRPPSGRRSSPRGPRWPRRPRARRGCSVPPPAPRAGGACRTASSRPRPRARSGGSARRRCRRAANRWLGIVTIAIVASTEVRASDERHAGRDQGAEGDQQDQQRDRQREHARFADVRLQRVFDRFVGAAAAELADGVLAGCRA